jgi:hypothetical protein
MLPNFRSSGRAGSGVPLLLSVAARRSPTRWRHEPFPPPRSRQPIHDEAGPSRSRQSAPLAGVRLNRFRSLIIIVGVLMAVFRIDQRIAKELESISNELLERVLLYTVSSLEAQSEVKLSEETRNEIREKVLEVLHKDGPTLAEEYAKELTRIFKWKEVTIVVLGKFLNGFGDTVARLVKQYGANSTSHRTRASGASLACPRR